MRGADEIRSSFETPLAGLRERERCGKAPFVLSLSKDERSTSRFETALAGLLRASGLARNPVRPELVEG